MVFACASFARLHCGVYPTRSMVVIRRSLAVLLLLLRVDKAGHRGFRGPIRLPSPGVSCALSLGRLGVD